MSKVLPAHREARAPLEAVEGAAAEARKESVDHDTELSVLASCLRDDERPSLPEGKRAASNPVAAADGIVADGTAAPPKRRRTGPRPRTLSSTRSVVSRQRASPRLARATSSQYRRPRMRAPSSVNGTTEPDAGYALLGHEGTVGVTPLQ